MGSATATEPASAGRLNGATERRRKPPTPKRLQKKALTLAQAAEQYERTDDALVKLGQQVAKLEAEREEAAGVLLAHFEKTGRASYRDRIGWCWSTPRLILDQAKVTIFLGEQLSKFQRYTESKRKLTRLTPPDPGT